MNFVRFSCLSLSMACSEFTEFGWVEFFRIFSGTFWWTWFARVNGHFEKKNDIYFFENYCDVMNMNKHLNCAKWIIKHDAVCIINIISSFWKMIQFVQWERFVCIDTDYRIDTKKIQYFRLSPLFFEKILQTGKKLQLRKHLETSNSYQFFEVVLSAPVFCYILLLPLINLLFFEIYQQRIFEK